MNKKELHTISIHLLFYFANEIIEWLDAPWKIKHTSIYIKLWVTPLIQIYREELNANCE